MSGDAFKQHLDRAQAEAEAALAVEAEQGPYFQDWWDRKPCELCGFVRRVRVHKTRGHGPTWNAHCRACEYELAAKKHDRCAAVAREHAREERARQRRNS